MVDAMNLFDYFFVLLVVSFVMGALGRLNPFFKWLSLLCWLAAGICGFSYFFLP
jgi:hypothetical protein